MGCGVSNSGVVVPALEDLDTGEPYSGPRAEYEFLNVDVTVSDKVTLKSTTMVTSDVDAYYPLLVEQFNKGFKLISFYHIPSQGRRRGHFTISLLTTFQGIFCRYDERHDAGRWQLRVEKAVLNLERGVFQQGCCSADISVMSDLSHIQQIIDSNAKNGARLICIEVTGQEKIKSSLTPKLPSMGVDIFFEVPLDRISETYMYNTVSVPLTSSYTSVCGQRPYASCDWQGTLDLHLNQGYRLVEIFMDFSDSAETSCSSGKREIGCKWFFEKPTSKSNDQRAVYEGKVVEHAINITMSALKGIKTKVEWEPVIQAMGNKGWELACILETCNTYTVGCGFSYMKVLIFFQRKVI